MRMPPARRAYGRDETALRKYIQGESTISEAKRSFCDDGIPYVSSHPCFGAPLWAWSVLTDSV